MSMASSGIAETNNKWKNDLVDKLENAVKVDGFYYSEAVDRVKKIIDELKEFHFSE